MNINRRSLADYLCYWKIDAGLEFVDPAVESLLIADQLSDVSSAVEAHLDLTLDQLLNPQYLRTDASPLRFDTVVLQAAAAHQLPIQRVYYFEQIVEQHLIADFVFLLTLLVVNEAVSFFVQGDDFELVLELLPVVLEHIQKDLAVGLLATLVVM